MLKKTLGTLVATTALVALTALPAHAAPLANGDDLTPLNGVTYTNFYENSFEVDDAETTGTVSDDIYDGIGEFEWSDGAGNWTDSLACYNADLSAATDDSGDQVLTCDSQDDIFTGINSRVDARFFAEGDLVRFDYTLTNTTDTAFDYDWWSINYYGDAFSTMTSEEIIAAGYDVQEGYDNGEFVGTAFGLPGSTGYPTEAGLQWTGSGDQTEVEGFGTDSGGTVYGSLAPGTSVTVSIFVFHNSPTPVVPYPSAAFESLQLWAADTFDAFDGRLVRGIAEGTNVVNWGSIGSAPVEEPVEAPVLAKTGTDATATALVGFAGLAALVAGLGVVLVARRRTAGSNA